MKQQSYFLGIDGGGSKTSVWCADAHGRIVGKGRTGPTNLTTTDTAVACANLKTAISQATQELVQPRFEAAVMGLAGMDTPSEHGIAQQVFGPILTGFGISRFQLVNDALIALKAGTEKTNAMVVIAGTGSNCHGRSELGRTAKAGGLDYWLSDEGAGFMIGWQALRAVVKAADGRGDRTSLSLAIMQHFAIKTVADLKSIVYGPDFSKKDMAELARIVVKAAENGDQVSYQIMSQAVAEIESLIMAVARQLDFEQVAFDCVAVGSVNALGFVRSRLEKWFALKYPQAKLIYPDKPPVAGALQMAFQVAFFS